jgi:sigma-B regulation protein RsbU (phosphoserine phosphatase)
MASLPKRDERTEIATFRLECLEVWGGNQRVSHAFELPGLDGWVYSEPVEAAVSEGDVHYLSVCSRGIISRIALADASGHGQSSGVIAELLRDLLRKHIDTWDQSELMRELNESLRTSLEANQFATAALFAYSRSTRELVFTNAGHPPALWYHAESGTWDWLEPATPFARWVEGLPLGLIPGTDYVQVAVRLNRDDLIILYTDGITDAADAAGNMLGGDGLLEIARNLPVESPVVMAERLLVAVQNFRGNALPDDDQSFFILRQLEG